MAKKGKDTGKNSLADEGKEKKDWSEALSSSKSDSSKSAGKKSKPSKSKKEKDAEKAAEKEKKEAEKAEAKKRKEEEKAAAKEEAMAEAEERRRNMSIHRFLVLTNRSMTDQLKAYRGEYTDVEDAQFTVFNSLLEKKNPPELPEAFGDYEASRIAEVNALVADVKKFESVMARLALAGATTDEISSVAGFDVSKAGFFTGRDVGPKQIAEKIRAGALRDTLFDHLISSDVPNEDLLNSAYIAGKQKIGSVKDERAATKKQTRDQDLAARIEVAIKNEDERRSAAQAKRNQKAIEERRRNYADSLRARGLHEEAGKAEVGDFDELLTSQENWDTYSDKKYTVEKGRRTDEEARRKRDEEERKEREREAKRREEEARRDLEERRSNAADYFKSQGKNKFAAEVAVGMHDDFVRNNWEALSQDRYAIFKGQRQDRKQQEEEEERQRKEREREEERRRKEEQAQRLREQKELDQKRELWAQYQEYSADADGRRFTATERLGITSGAAGRDREFSGKSIEELEQMVAGAKDRASESESSRRNDSEQTRELKHIVRLLTGIRLTTAQSKSIMKRLGSFGGMDVVGTKIRMLLASLMAFKFLANAKEKEFAQGLKAGGELTSGSWTMKALAMSEEEKRDIKQESLAARRYNISNEEILQARQKTAAGIAALHNGDASFFKPLWNVGFPVSIPTDTKDFEEQLTKFLNNAAVSKHQKIAVMQALGRNEKQMMFSMNRTKAMADAEQETEQAIAADNKEEAVQMARSEVERRYEDRNRKIEASNIPFLLKWIPKLNNWFDKMNEASSIGYDEKTGKSTVSDYRNRSFFRDMAVHMLATALPGGIGVAAENIAQVTTVPKDIEITPPSMDDLDAASQRAKEIAEATNRSANAGTKNEINVKADYHIIGSRQDAEVIADKVRESQKGLAAEITNNNPTSELGGR